MTSGTEGKPAVNKWFIAFIVAMAAFIEILDNSVGNVAVPHIAGNLSATMSQATWVLTSYIVANSVVLPLSGWLSSVFGRKRYFLGSVILFTVASVMCGLAPNLGLLVLFRVLQGLAGGGLLTASQAILADTFDPKELGKAMAVYAIATVVAPIIGPVIGGWITDNFSWRWIFLINLPIGMVSAALVAKFITDPPHFKRADLSHGLNFDYTGIALLSVAIAAIQVVLDRGQELDWFGSTFITVASVVGIASLLAAVVWELRVKDPVVDLRLLGNSNVCVAVIVMFATGIIIYGASALVPMFVQNMMGYSATLAGWALAPGGMACVIAMPVIGILITKGHLRWYVATGLLATAFSMYMMEKSSLAADMHYIVVSRIIMSVGVSMIMLPSIVASFAFVSKDKNDAVSGITNLARNIGGSVGIAILTLILDRRMQYHQAILVQHMTPYDPYYRQMSAAATHLMSSAVGAANALHAARGVIYALMQQQCGMLSYIDAFHFMTVITLVVIPIGLLLKSPKHVSGGGLAMH
jgi:DHA2 family multidrug resistance protein